MAPAETGAISIKFYGGSEALYKRPVHSVWEVVVHPVPMPAAGNGLRADGGGYGDAGYTTRDCRLTNGGGPYLEEYGFRLWPLAPSDTCIQDGGFTGWP